jgi:hypothetical protein
LTPNVTLNTLESMIEYTLISSILDKNMWNNKKKRLEYPWNDIILDPLWNFLKIKTWGTWNEKGNWQNKWMGSMVMG